MREIKFRAWDIESNDMWSWNELNEWAETLENQMWQVLHQDHYIAMQYTGLKDKNDKEIYEGDIVKYSTGYCLEVVWTSNLYCYDGSMSGTGFNIGEDGLNCEVFGNIYENPELLKGGIINE